MKTKYERMNAVERRKLIEKYKRTETGKTMFFRLRRLNVTGILCLIFSVGLTILDWNHLQLIDCLTIVPLFLASLLFIMMSYKLKKKVLNNFALKRK